MPNPIVHAEIRSKDPDATRAFFGGLFGWTFPEGAIPGYTYVDSGVPDALPAGISPLQGGNALVTFFVGVEDIDATVADAERRGGSVVQPVMRVPGVAFALIAPSARSRLPPNPGVVPTSLSCQVRSMDSRLFASRCR